MEFDDDQWQRVTAASCLIKDYPIRLCDKSFMTVSDVMLQCRAWAVDGGLLCG
jgi:ABC-type thiamine transport system ATPase subunit